MATSSQGQETKEESFLRLLAQSAEEEEVDEKDRFLNLVRTEAENLWEEEDEEEEEEEEAVDQLDRFLNLLRTEAEYLGEEEQGSGEETGEEGDDEEEAEEVEEEAEEPSLPRRCSYEFLVIGASPSLPLQNMHQKSDVEVHGANKNR